MRGSRGQASTEYLMLLCAVLTVSVMTGTFLSRYGQDLAERVADHLLEAAIQLAAP